MNRKAGSEEIVIPLEKLIKPGDKIRFSVQLLTELQSGKYDYVLTVVDILEGQPGEKILMLGRNE